MEAHSFARAEGGRTLPRSRRLLAAFGDERLVAQLRRGNEAAFETLYDRHHAGVLSYCRHMLGSRDEAEDALQQAFVSAHADIVSSEKPIRFKAWIYTIARNRCLSVLRSRREQPSADVERASTEGLGEEVQHRAELRELLSDLQELPDDQRDALILAELGDLSHAEVASVIQCEVAKVKSLVFQARSGLLERREARETPCHEIREQLATLRGGSLRRGPLRRHVKACPGCSEFREEVRRQRQAFAALLPVAPTLALKENALAAVGIGVGTAGGAALGSAGAIFTAKAGVAKVAAIAVATTGVVGGAVTVERKVAGNGDRGSSGREDAGAAPAPAPATSPAPARARAAAMGNRPHTLAETVRMSVIQAGLGPSVAGGTKGSSLAGPGGDGGMILPFGDDGRFGHMEGDKRGELKPEHPPKDDEGRGRGDDGDEETAREQPGGGDESGWRTRPKRGADNAYPGPGPDGAGDDGGEDQEGGGEEEPPPDPIGPLTPDLVASDEHEDDEKGDAEADDD